METRESAPPVADHASPYIFSIRPSIGFGAGDSGIGGRLGATSEYWITDYLGIGLEGALLGETQIFGSSASAMTIAPVVAFRSAPRGGYFVAELGTGYAKVERVKSSGFCLDLDGRGCPPDAVTDFSGYTVSAAVGWLAHPGQSLFEIGPVARFDAMGGVNQHLAYVITANLELGLAVFEPKPIEP